MSTQRKEYDTHYEYLRPIQLIEKQKQCPLVILPIGPLEYHGPHLPLGTDPINSTYVSHECCRRIMKGVVMPTLYAGTERERTSEVLGYLGFETNSYIVGMDFPSRMCNSHYLPEEVFALIISSEIQILIKQRYRYIFIANGHGARNQQEVLKRLSKYFNNTTNVKVDYCLTLARKTAENGEAGHASIVETSLVMNYDKKLVDFYSLPKRGKSFKYADFSIVDGRGFTDKHDPEQVVHNDPRDASAEKGKQWFEAAVNEMTEKIKVLISE